MAGFDIPDEMARLRSQLPGLVSGLETRLPYAAVWLGARSGIRIRVADREEQVSETPPTAGTVLTAYDGRTLHERAIGGFDLAKIEQASADLQRELIRQNGQTIDPGPERQGDYVVETKIDPRQMSTQEKLERCRDIHRRLKALDNRLVNVTVSYLELNEASVFNNRSADLGQSISRVYLFIMAAVSGEQGVRINWRTWSGTGGWEKLDFTDQDLQELAQRAIQIQSAERIEPGEYTIVASPGVTGTIVHESFGHGVETDMFLKDRARAAHFIDQPVGSSLVSIYDDPSYPGMFGSYFFDDEGQLAGPTEIVAGGIFKRGITDLYSASELGIPRSANGRRQDYTRKAYARMSTTFFGQGATPVDDLFAQVDQGIYLVKWSSGMEDPKGWGIQVTCHYGFEIKNGKVTGRMFAPVGISGYVPDVLASVQAVGNDFSIDGGNCGKGHKEWAPVSSGGPHVLLKARLG